MGSYTTYSGLQQLCYGLAEASDLKVVPMEASAVASCLFGLQLKGSNISNLYKGDDKRRQARFLEVWRKEGDVDPEPFEKQERAIVEEGLLKRAKAFLSQATPEQKAAFLELLNRKKYQPKPGKCPDEASRVEASLRLFARKASPRDRAAMGEVMGAKPLARSERVRAIRKAAMTPQQWEAARRLRAAGLLVHEKKASLGLEPYDMRVAIERCVSFITEEDMLHRVPCCDADRFLNDPLTGTIGEDGDLVVETAPELVNLRREFATGFGGDFTTVALSLLPQMAEGFHAQRQPSLAINAFCRDFETLSAQWQGDSAKKNALLMRRLVAAAILGPAHPLALAEDTARTCVTWSERDDFALPGEEKGIVLTQLYDDHAATVGNVELVRPDEAVFFGRSTHEQRFPRKVTSLERRGLLEGVSQKLNDRRLKYARIASSHEAVGGAHGLLLCDEGVWRYYDLDSTYGTLVLGIDPSRDCYLPGRESAHQPKDAPRCCELMAGDVIHLGACAKGSSREGVGRKMLYHKGAAILVSACAAPDWARGMTQSS